MPTETADPRGLAPVSELQAKHGLMVACFAEYAVVPAGGAVRLPRSIPLCQAALLGCGVVTGIGAVNRAGVRVGGGVRVIGASDQTAVRRANREAVRKAIGVAVNGRDPGAAAALMARRDQVTSPFYGGESG
jgi:Zn-dependent alcohol dehydrogenase